MRNAINWFEIPATDFNRAVAFYRTVLGQEIRTGEFMGVPHGFFPAEDAGVAGAIIAPPDAAPSTSGPLIYLNDSANYTVPLALRSFVDATGTSAWGQLFAMSVLAILPIFLVFLFFQRLIIEGVAMSGMKR